MIQPNRILTVFLSTTPDVPMPVNPDLPQGYSPQAGFKLTITKTSSQGILELPVENKLVWTIGDFIVGETYELLIQAVDIDGRIIQGLPVHSFIVPPSTTVPPSLTFTRLEGFELVWSDMSTAVSPI